MNLDFCDFFFFSEEPQDFYRAPEALGEFSGAQERAVRNTELSVVYRNHS